MNSFAVILATTFTVVLLATTRYFIRDELFHPVNLVNAIMAYYVLAPAWYLIGTETYRFRHILPGKMMATTLSVVFASYLVILGVYLWTDVDRNGGRLASLLRHRQLNQRTLAILGTLGFGLGVLSYLYYVVVNGGFIHLLTVQPRTAFSSPQTMRYRFLAYAGVFAGMVTILTAYHPKIIRRRVSLREYVFLGTMIAIVFLMVLTLRSRMNIVIPAGYLLLYADSTDRLPSRYLIGAGCVVFAVGMGYTFVETLFRGGKITPRLLITAGLVDTIRLEVLMDVIHRVPKNHPYQWGVTFVHSMGIRWKGMPLSYGNQLELIVLGKTRDYITFPALMLGELYLNFGLIGTLLGSAGFGWALKKVYCLYNVAFGGLRGIIPLILVGVVSMLPTSIDWGIRSIGIRIVVPVFFAVVVAKALSKSMDQNRWFFEGGL
jgi:hypothetical protein